MDNPEQLCFRALADPTRRGILHLLARGEMSIAEVATHFDMTRAAVKKHLSVLDQGGLITMRAQGRATISTLNPHGIKRAFDWLRFFDAFWDDRLAALKTEIEKDTQ